MMKSGNCAFKSYLSWLLKGEVCSSWTKQNGQICKWVTGATRYEEENDVMTMLIGEPTHSPKAMLTTHNS